MNDDNRGCLERFWASLDTTKGRNLIAARGMNQAPHDLMLAVGRYLRDAC